MPALPELTAENTAFWTGGEHGELRIAFCRACEAAIHPPQVICPRCFSDEVVARAVPGTGTVYTCTVNHQPWLPGMDVPFALAVVDLDGAPGVRVTARVIDAEPAQVFIGQQMKVAFEQVDDVWIPQWKPAE